MTSGDFSGSDKRREQDYADLQNEIAGRGVGRINRFLPSNRIDNPENQRKKDAELSHLLNELQQRLQDPDYRAAFERANDLIDQTQIKLTNTLDAVAERIEHLEALRETSDSKAVRDALITAREKQDRLSEIQRDIVTPAKDTLNDKDYPLDLDEIEDLEKQVQKASKEIGSLDSIKSNFDAVASNNDTAPHLDPAFEIDEFSP